MNVEKLFCPDIDCTARGQTGQGNVGVHSQKGKRAVCNVCNKSVATSNDTIFYQLRTDPRIVMLVIVLLANGCHYTPFSGNGTLRFANDER